MKKLISFVMAAAMVASLVPATAFAAGYDVKATAKVVGAETIESGSATVVFNNTEVQLTITDAAAVAGNADTLEFKVALDGATFTGYDEHTGVYNDYDGIKINNGVADADITNDAEVDDDDFNELTITLTAAEVNALAKDDVIKVPLDITLDKAGKGATVSVESDDMTVSLEDAPVVVVKDAGFTASVKKTVKVAEEEVITLNDLVIKESVPGSMPDVAAGKEFTLKLSKGFEFDLANGVHNIIMDLDGDTPAVAVTVDDNEMTFRLQRAVEKVTIPDLEIEATTAKAGTTGTITVSVDDMDKQVVEVVEVVDYKVIMSVDEDEDVPVIYSGVDTDNTGITDGSDHKTLEITLEETFPGAWSSRQGFDITLPDGVYVTDVDVKSADDFYDDGVELTEGDWELLFREAYTDGSESNFEFGKRVFDDVDVTLQEDPASITFVLTLIAEPGFEGDVTVGFEGALVDSQEVVAAKFVAPYTVVAEQNDVKIDSRYTDLGTPVVVKEAADGLWEKGAQFGFEVETNYIQFEDTATYTADNDMELTNEGDVAPFDLSYEVKTESDKAATVTIDDIQLFLDRTVPEGPYTLEIGSTLAGAAGGRTGFINEGLFTNDRNNDTMAEVLDVNGWYTVDVKDKFVNIITAPRDEDGFTTKISVPVGESYIIAGEKKVEIDTPAYINANGYTMLPLRAVAVALGVDNNSVIWDQATRTATILYGNRIVSMQNGANVMYINAQAVPTKAGVEITNNRTFLSLRDLGTAMNVTDITWDAATRTAYLNAGVEA